MGRTQSGSRELTDNNLASKTAETTDIRETHLSIADVTAPVLTTADTYETPAQKLKRQQLEVRTEAARAAHSIVARLAAIAVEAAELSQIDAFSKEMRQALSQVAATTEGSVRVLNAPKA